MITTFGSAKCEMRNRSNSTYDGLGNSHFLFPLLHYFLSFSPPRARGHGKHFALSQCEIGNANYLFPISHFPFRISVVYHHALTSHQMEKKSISHFLFRISHFAFPISHFLFRISHFAFPILHFLFRISHLAFPISHFLFRISVIDHDALTLHHMDKNLFRISYFAFPTSHFPFHISYFASPISHLLFRISHFRRRP